MHSLEFDLEHDYDSGIPDDHELGVIIRVFPTGLIPIAVNAQIDTGASISMFDKSLLPLFGITDITTGSGFPVETANRQRETAYAHDIEIEFLGMRMAIPVGFCAAWPDGTPNLLGMKGFLEHLQIGLRHGNRLLYLSPA
jgi:hypothetical protein